MVEVRINGKRFPTLQAVDTAGTLMAKLENMGNKEGTVLTQMFVNGRRIEVDSQEIARLKLDSDDTVEAFMETAEQLSLDSLFVAQEMAELLAFDIKVATLQIWDNTRLQNKSLETLISDCTLFLSLGARPVTLLGVELSSLSKPAEGCLRQLDEIAEHVEDTTLLAVNGKSKEACQVLLTRLVPAIEKWLGLTGEFAKALGWNPNENYSQKDESPEAVSLKTVAKFAQRASNP